MLHEHDIVIKVRNAGKAFRIGSKEQKQENLVNAILETLKKPFKNYRQILSLKKIDAASQEEDIFWANKNISFDLHKGEVLGIIGKNGSGKSTLLKILSRIMLPTEGRIEIEGRVASLLEVGTGFNPNLTGAENIYLNGTILGLSKKEIAERYDQIIEFSGIEKFIDTPVKRYSSGMKVRLAFAVAAHLEPDILIIDEVLAVGDAEFQKKCLGKMQEVTASQGRTILFVSHDMVAVKKLCTRALLLHKGSVIKEGTPDEVVEFYLKNDKLFSVTNTYFNTDNRKGTGAFILTGIDFANAEKLPVTILETGMDRYIRLQYQVLEKGPNPVFNIIIRNNLQQEIINISSKEAYDGMIKLDEAGEVRIHIAKLPLLPGIYAVDYNCKYDYSVTDMVENALTIQVEKGDFFGTGRINDTHRNGIALYHTWHL